MIRIMMLALVLALSNFAESNSSDYVLKEEWVEQRLYPFSQSNETFDQQLLMLIPQELNHQADIFFVLGNETDAKADLLEKLYKSYGRPRNTVFAVAEHRGYGQSVKKGNNTVPDYVSIDRALLDDLHVLEELKKRYTGNVIVAGYSYGGALSILFTHYYPNMVDVALSSSAPIEWPFLIDEYSAHSTQQLGEELTQRLREHGENLKPEKIHDENWRLRELVSGVISGLSQDQNSQSMLPIISTLSYLPTSTFAWLLDTVVPERAKHWSDNRIPQNITYEMAKTGDYNWYTWKYQQCFELGTFFSGGGFAQSQEEYLEDCLLTFGKESTYVNSEPINLAPIIQHINTPLVIVSGGKDPWIELGVKPNHNYKNIEYIYDKEGFHCPDKDDPELGKTVFNLIKEALPPPDI